MKTRSPTDFYQLDVEMSFVTQDDVFAAVQPVLQGLFEHFGKGRKVHADWPRIAYRDSLKWFGSDKPDLRNPIRMQDVSEHFRGSGFAIFAKLLEQEGNEVRAIPAPGGTRKFCDRMDAYARGQGLPGMGYIFWRESEKKYVKGVSQIADLLWGWCSGEVPRNKLDILMKEATPTEESNALQVISYMESNRSDQAKPAIAELFGVTVTEAAGPIAKALGEEASEVIRLQLGLEKGDAAFFLGGKPETFEPIAGRARNVIGEELGLTDKDSFRFAWIVDFPMYEKTDEGKIDFSHNPFSMPQGGLEALMGDPLDVYAYQYDLACNGYEVISGGIRNHKPEIMYKAFELAGYPNSEVDKRFGGMVKAFKYGAPPHGGCAAGIDRLVMLLADTQNIREVIMFPMNQRAEDLLMGAPSEPMNDQLRELRLRVLPKDA
jgi:aspartyl-tRNA synthetase